MIYFRDYIIKERYDHAYLIRYLFALISEVLLRLCLSLNHLRGNKLKHSFQNFLNPIYIFGIDDIKTCYHYLVHCFINSTERLDLLKSIRNISFSILQKTALRFIRSVAYVLFIFHFHFFILFSQ